VIELTTLLVMPKTGCPETCPVRVSDEGFRPPSSQGIILQTLQKRPLEGDRVRIAPIIMEHTEKRLR